MGFELVRKSVNQIEPGTVVFEEGAPVNFIGILLAGKVELVSKGSRKVMGPGNFIGLIDIHSKKYLANVKVLEKANIFAFPVNSEEDLMLLLSANKDYPGLIMKAALREFTGQLAFQKEIGDKCGEFMNFVNTRKKLALEYATGYGYKFEPNEVVDVGKAFECLLKPDALMVAGYKEAALVPADICKAFYAGAKNLAVRQIQEISQSYDRVKKDTDKAAHFLEKFYNCLTVRKHGSYLSNLSRLIGKVESTGKKCDDLGKVYDEIENMTKELRSYLLEKTGFTPEDNDDLWEKLRAEAKTAAAGAGEGMSTEEQLAEFEDSFAKIVSYGRLEKEKADALAENIKVFMSMKDKFASDDAARKMRRSLLEPFYELYHNVYKRAYEERNKDKIIDLFLNYGFLDERLLEPNQLILLYHHAELKEEDDDRIHVYTAREWLDAIYEMRKDPSKNEFDMDYYEYLRDLKNQKSITEEQEKKEAVNKEARLDFEIKNMLKYNCRIVSGQITTFVPFIHKDMFAGDLGRMFMSKELVRNTIDSLAEIDFSVFYREVLYVDESKGIKKEYIQKEVVPDIVMLPMYGDRVSMWQEISGRKRDTPGRFLMPALSDGDLNDMFIPVLGRFRWELCRTIQGTSWNDIKVKSLTSEYSDYIQFYKKNKDLSEERKEKVKAQIQKGKNNVKEVFAMDYETWIKNESQGAMRLNKVVREMMCMYCPFTKDIRDNLCKQTIYDEAFGRFNRENQRKQKELEGRLRHIENEGGTVTEELKDTLDYYRNK